jgi:hypothetical protein
MEEEFWREPFELDLVVVVMCFEEKCDVMMYGYFGSLACMIEGQRNQPSQSNFPKFGLDMR